MLNTISFCRLSFQNKVTDTIKMANPNNEMETDDERNTCTNWKTIVHDHLMELYRERSKIDTDQLLNLYEFNLNDEMTKKIMVYNLHELENYELPCEIIPADVAPPLEENHPVG